MKQVLAVILGLSLIAVLGQPALTQDRVAGSTIRDRIEKRMETRRLERVPRLGGAAAWAPGAGHESIIVKGQPRTFVRYTPNSVLVSGKKAPVVFALHGSRGTADRLQTYLGLNTVADREGFVVVYPQGENNRWNDGREAGVKAEGQSSDADDVAFLNGLADALVAQGVADPKRLYLMGVSNGGFMTLALACNPAARFAAFGAVIATIPAGAPAACQPGHPVPVVMINGTEDEIIRFDGGPGKYGVAGNLSPADAAQAFAALSGCTTQAQSDVPAAGQKDGTTVTLKSWGGCNPGGAAEFYTVKGGGHQPPSREPRTAGDAALDVYLGTRSHALDTAETVWAFFKRF